MAGGRRRASFGSVMPALVPTLARVLHTVSLGLWLGGLLAIGALVAPTAFHLVRAQPSFAGDTALQNAVAGGIVGGSLRVFNFVCTGCGVLLLLANTLLLRPGASRLWTRTCLILSALLLLSALGLGFGLTPAMEAAQARGDLITFDRMHHLYEQASLRFQFPLLLLLALFSAMRDTTRPSL